MRFASAGNHRNMVQGSPDPDERPGRQRKRGGAVGPPRAQLPRKGRDSLPPDMPMTTLPDMPMTTLPDMPMTTFPGPPGV